MPCIPRRRMSDRDPKFVSKLMDTSLEFAGARLPRSTTHHPQSDGQTEKDVPWRTKSNVLGGISLRSGRIIWLLPSSLMMTLGKRPSIPPLSVSHMYRIPIFHLQWDNSIRINRACSFSGNCMNLQVLLGYACTKLRTVKLRPPASAPGK